MTNIPRDTPLLEDPARYALAMLLQVEGELSVSALADRLDIRYAYVSQHLAKLRNAGLVEAVAVGHHHRYRIRADRAAEVATDLARITHNRRAAAEVERKQRARARSAHAGDGGRGA